MTISDFFEKSKKCIKWMDDHAKDDPDRQQQKNSANKKKGKEDKKEKNVDEKKDVTIASTEDITWQQNLSKLTGNPVDYETYMKIYHDGINKDNKITFYPVDEKMAIFIKGLGSTPQGGGIDDDHIVAVVMAISSIFRNGIKIGSDDIFALTTALVSGLSISPRELFEIKSIDDLQTYIQQQNKVIGFKEDTVYGIRNSLKGGRNINKQIQKTKKITKYKTLAINVSYKHLCNRLIQK